MAMTPPLPPTSGLHGTAPIDLGTRDKALSMRLPPHLVDRIYQDIGSATMAWENIGGAGVFKSEMAAKIAEELGHAIADELDARDLIIKPYLANAAFSIDRVLARLRERTEEPHQVDATIRSDVERDVASPVHELR